MIPGTSLRYAPGRRGAKSRGSSFVRGGCNSYLWRLYLLPPLPVLRERAGVRVLRRSPQWSVTPASGLRQFCLRPLDADGILLSARRAPRSVRHFQHLAVLSHYAAAVPLGRMGGAHEPLLPTGACSDREPLRSARRPARLPCSKRFPASRQRVLSLLP